MDLPTHISTGHVPSPETPGSCRPGTLAVHAGEDRYTAFHSLTVPIVQTATYTFQDTAALIEFLEERMFWETPEREEYGRYGNPTTAGVEAKLAALEGTEAALLFASGMAAITTVFFAMLGKGSHVVITGDAYRRTRQFVTRVLPRFGVDFAVVPPGDYEALEEACTPKTRILFSESPTNPYLNVLDLPRVAEIGKRRRVKTVIDATFATPYNQRPADFGIDLVIHSATKYLGGHNDLMAGVVAGKRGIISAIKDFQGVVGGVSDPFAAYLLQRGLKTFALRMERQNQSAQAMAELLEAHPKVARVYYPGLPSHPHHAIAAAQMRGFGGVVSFEVAGDLDAGSRLVDACTIPRIAPSLGGVESLIEQPALMSFYELTTEEREAIGIKDSLIRFALGVEDPGDLQADILQALERV